MSQGQETKIIYGIDFTADTTEVKSQLSTLMTQLNKVSSIPLKIETTQLKEAKEAAIDLQKYLNFSTDGFGKLNLNTFSAQLSKAGTSVSELSNKLLRVGSEGTQAFSSLVKVMSSAEVPTRTVSENLTKILGELKRNAVWQLSNAAIYKMTDSLGDAVAYAHRLNSSLNDIRIVSGQSAEQMADFAVEANKAAKALSATTTDYTDASLIFYQEGLRGQDVTERADTTIKLANVTGDTAEEVSSYMTAIWNNFDDGSESLEHYADVITALGAATASSSAEIAEGLEKFASIADTVGLSYDYATSAIATVVAKTRQSASTIGNSFKTIFSRLEGLNLGETLDDGTTLNKYSEALYKVGVNIKDTSGNIKSADQILDDLMAKWNTLAQDQKIALAQTVAGTQQYTRLISLLDNQETFYKNLQTAANSEGTLTEQAEIYAESWTAAKKQVQASLEGIYNQLNLDDFATGGMHVLSGLFDSISAVTKGIGGLKGIILALGSMVAGSFSQQISNGFNNFRNNIKITLMGEQQLIDMQWELQKTLENRLTNSGLTENSAKEIQDYVALLRLKEQVRQANKNLSQQEADWNNVIIQGTQKAIENLAQLRQAADDTAAEFDEIFNAFMEDQAFNETFGLNALKFAAEEANSPKEIKEMINGSKDQWDAIYKLSGAYTKYKIEVESAKYIVEDLTTATQNLATVTVEDINNIKSQTGELIRGIESSNEELFADLRQIPKVSEQIDNLLNGNYDKIEDINTALKSIITTVRQISSDASKATRNLNGIFSDEVINRTEQVKNIDAQAKKYAQANNEVRRQEEGVRGLSGSVVLEPVKADGVKAVMDFAGGLGQAAFFWQTMASLPSIITNDDISGMEKFVSIIMSLSMSVPSIINAFKMLNQATSQFELIKNQKTAAVAASISADKKYSESVKTVETATEKLKEKEQEYQETLREERRLQEELNQAREDASKAKENKKAADKDKQKYHNSSVEVRRANYTPEQAVQINMNSITADMAYEEAQAHLENTEALAEETQQRRAAIEEERRQINSTLNQATATRNETQAQLERYINAQMGNNLFTQELMQNEQYVAMLEERAVLENELQTLTAQSNIDNAERIEEILILIQSLNEELTEEERQVVLQRLQQAGNEGVALSYQELRAALAGEITEEQLHTIVTNNSTLSVVAAAIANKEYAVALQAVGAAIKANKLNAIIIGTTALFAAVKGVKWAYDKLTQSAEEAQEAMSDATTAVTDSQSELDSVKSELESINSQIQEIQSQSSLSFTDEQTLTDLQEEKKLLEQKLKIQEKIVEQKQKEAIIESETKKGLFNNDKTTFVNSFEGSTDTTTYNPYNSNDGNIQIKGASLKRNVNGSDIFSDVGTVDEWINYYNELIALGDEKSLELAETIKNGLDNAFDADEYADKIDEWNTILESYADSGREYSSAFYDNLEAMSNATKAFYGTDYAETIAELMDENDDATDSLRENYAEIQELLTQDLSEEDLVAAFDKLGIDSGDALIKSLYQSGISLGDFLQEFTQQVENSATEINDAFQNTMFAKDSNNSAGQIIDSVLGSEQLINYFNENPDMQSYIADLAKNGDSQGILDAFGFNEEAYKSMGYDSGEAFVSGFIESYRENIGQSFDDIVGDMDISDQLRDRLRMAYNSLSEEDKSDFLEIVPTLDETELNNILTDTKGYIDRFNDENNAIEIKTKIESDIENLDYDFAIDDVQELADTYYECADQIEGVSKDLKGNRSASLQAAYGVMQLNEGIDELADGYDDWIADIKGATKASPGFTKAMKEMKNAVADVVGLADEMADAGYEFSDGFIQNNLDLIQQAADGDEEAINSLRRAAAEDIFLQINGVTNFDQLPEETQILYNNLQSILSEQDLTIGATIDDQAALDAMTELVNACGMTAQEASNALAAMGVDAEIVEAEPTQTSMPIYDWVMKTAEFILPSGIFGALTKGTAQIPSAEIVGETKGDVQLGAPALKVISATGNVTSGGNITKSKKGGYSSGKKSSGSGGSGKSSGSGSGSTYKADPVDNDNDPFVYLKESLEDLQGIYDRTDTAKERMYDTSKYDKYIDSEITNLQEQIDKTKEYETALRQLIGVKGQDGWSTSLKKQLTDLGAQFDTRGSIINEYALREAWQNQENAELAKATDSDAADAIKEKYEERLDLLDKIKEYHDDLVDLQQQELELTQQIIDKELEKVSNTVDVEIAVDDTDLSILEERLAHLEHYDFKASLEVAVQEDKLSVLQSQVDTYSTAVDKYKALMEANPDDTEVVAAYQDAVQNLMSAMQDLEDMVDTIGEMIEKTFTQITDEADHATNIFNSYASILSSLQNTLTSAGQKYTKNTTYMKISEAINKTAMNQLEVLKEEYAVAENEVTLLQQSYDRLKAEGADDAVLKQYKDQLKSQQESLAEIGSELASALESTLSNIVEQLSDEFENALYLAEEELFKVIDLDTAKTFYDEYADLADNFLDSVEKTYELDTLMRKINSSMVDSKNLTGQKKLVDLAAEVADYQSSSAKMSQYEVDLLQAKYDLTLAQIALEESQNAKTQMRLTRDNSGNYSYVYTADQSAIDDAQQDVADKEKALYDLSKSYESEISEMWLELLSQYEEDQQQLFQKYQEGLITYDDYIDKKAEIDDIYYEKLDYLYGELNKVYKNSTLTFDNSVLQLATGANTLTELFDDSCTFINNVSDEATEKAEKNADLIEQALGSVGLSSLELSNTFDSAADSIISAGDDLKTSTVTSLEEMNAALQENLNEVENWARQVSAAFQEVASIRESTLTSTESSVSAPDYSILYMESIQSGDTTTAKAALKARAAKIAAGADDYGVTNSALSAWGSAYTNSSSSMNSAAQSLVTDSGTLAERLEKYGFDTGGYTGDWGSDGRLALLHQKELVLNQEDTQNILDAVSLIRSMNDVIMSSIKGDALATSYALSKMANAETAETTKDTIVQQVMIEANFEGATDAIEIKNALQGLINDAAQYAGQKNF